MGNIVAPEQVKLFIGFIYKDNKIFETVASYLSKKLGPIDTRSDAFVFDKTSYYDREMGGGLKKRFISFKGVRKAHGVERVKHLTNKIEDKYSLSGKRRINIDPGYMTQGKVVLLTTKDYIHRIYLGRSIYAEVTLYYKDKSYRPWDWTYPDYKKKTYIEYFNRTRESLAKKIA